MRASLSQPADYAGWGGNEAFSRSGPADRAASGNDLLTLCLLLIPVLGTTFFSKLAVPGIHVDGIGMGFPLIFLSLAIATCIAGNTRLEPTRLLFFCLMCAVIGSFAILQGTNVSLPSLAFLMLLHLPYVVRLEGAERVLDATYRGFLNVAVFIALCGVAQYVLQFFIAPALVFPLENRFPADWLVTGFNMQAPIAYGSNIYRANGIFMQEPSFFSQFLAIAMLVELLGTARLWRIALFAVAIVCSHSGTGLILLAVCMPVLVISRRRWNLVLVGVIALVVLVVAAPYLHIDHLLARVGEFGSERSSAYERFVGGFRIFEQSVGAEPARMLFGYGAGSYRDLVHVLDHRAAEMALFKIVVEYGLVGALLYFGFVLFCIFGSRGPFVLRLALVVSLFLNGAYNTFVHSLALALLIWPSTGRSRDVIKPAPVSTRESADPAIVARPTC